MAQRSAGEHASSFPTIAETAVHDDPGFTFATWSSRPQQERSRHVSGHGSLLLGTVRCLFAMAQLVSSSVVCSFALAGGVLVTVRRLGAAERSATASVRRLLELTSALFHTVEGLFESTRRVPSTVAALSSMNEPLTGTVEGLLEVGLTPKASLARCSQGTRCRCGNGLPMISGSRARFGEGWTDSIAVPWVTSPSLDRWFGRSRYERNDGARLAMQRSLPIGYGTAIPA